MTFSLDTTYWHAYDALSSDSLHRMLLALGHILEDERRQFGRLAAAALAIQDAGELRRRGYSHPKTHAASGQYVYGQALADVTGQPVEYRSARGEAEHLEPQHGCEEERIRAELIEAIRARGVANPAGTVESYLRPARMAASARRLGGRGTSAWILAGAVEMCRAVIAGRIDIAVHPDCLRWHPDATDPQRREAKWREATAAYRALQSLAAAV